MLTRIRQEKPIFLAILVALLSMLLEPKLLSHGMTVALCAAAVLVVTILLTSVRVAHHAQKLAKMVGEPYGTMILTLSSVLVEVIILGIVMTHSPSPTLVRDTIYSAVMLDINGILGLSALLGGLRYGEQPYNVDSGNTYIVMIMTALGVSMIVSQFVGPGQVLSYCIFTVITMLLMYAIFLRMQTKEHSYFFSYSYAKHGKDTSNPPGSLTYSAVCLSTGIALIGLLSEVMAKTLNVGLAATRLPLIISALLVAFISASPELLTALRAALANRMQAVVNIALGASLSTVILTIPIMEALALLTHKPIVIGLSPVQTTMIGLTLFVTAINLHDGETNAIEGMTNFVLFSTFLMLTVMGL